MFAASRLAAVSWWLVAWVAATCAGAGYYLGRLEGDRGATQRIERDERERTDARERFACEQAERTFNARQN